MLKKTLCIFISALILLSLISCAEVSRKISDGYRDDVTSEEAVNRIIQAVPSSDGYKTVDSDYISRMNFGDRFGELTDSLADWCVVTSTHPETNADTIGVFHVKNPDSIQLATDVITEYVNAQKLRMSTVFSSYAPAEMPKIDNAEITQCGNYILFTFLEESREEIAEDCFEELIEK
ncbi:MAG: DUF4358 domain-containing protein [Ruminococcaceae bacterium]|nr:DUF4358 domain-containing protein [Oscillospiraceae bacterium]